MNWQAVTIFIGALCSIGGLAMGAYSLRLAVKRHRAQAGSEELDYQRKIDEAEDRAALARVKLYANSLDDANEEMDRMRRRIQEMQRQMDRDRDELQKAIEKERGERIREHAECDRKLAAGRAEREQQVAGLQKQIADLHQKIGQMTAGQA